MLMTTKENRENTTSVCMRVNTPIIGCKCEKLQPGHRNLMSEIFSGMTQRIHMGFIVIRLEYGLERQPRLFQRPCVSSPYSHSSSQPPIIPTPGDPTPLSDLQGLCHTCAAH